MPSAIDLTGQRYGRLTAISLATLDGKRRHWLFNCDCGKQVALNPAYVRSGKTKSCGCFRKEATSKAKLRDFSGQVIGRLTILNMLAEKATHNRITWLCRCSCGTETVRTSHALGKKNPTLSCGCLRRETAAATRRASRQENPVSKTPAYKAAIKRKRRERPEVVAAERVSRMLALAIQSVGGVKQGRTFSILGYKPPELRAHIERQFMPGMTWENRAEWEIDHITPISSASSVEEVIALNQLANLRPLWAAENNRKKNKRLFLI